MSADTFRELCAELVEKLHGYASANPHHDSDELVARARIQLAQPEPEALTDEELLELAAKALGYKSIPSDETDLEADAGELLAFARAVEAAVLARWCRPTPQPPAEGEVAELVEWLRESAHYLSINIGSAAPPRLTRAAELLQRQYLQPVAIPGEEYHEDMGPRTWWRLPVEEPPWVGTPNDSDWPGYHTHFTPAPPTPCNARALPLPTSEEASSGG